jgi:hypothetical protein
MKKKGTSLLAIASVMAATTGLYILLKRRSAQRRNSPPEGAPQLKIDNPGDQSEFPAAPQGERDLG